MGHRRAAPSRVHRPAGATEPAPGWGGGKLNAATVALTPLTDAETAQVIAHVLERAVIPADIQRILLERAEGNPLYAEQFAAPLYRSAAPPRSCPSPRRSKQSSPRDSTASHRTRSSSSRTPRSWARCSGPAVSTGPGGMEPSLTRSPARGSCADNDARRSRARASTRSRMCSCVTSPTARSRERSARGSIKAPAEWIESLGRSDDHAEMVAHHWRAALELAQATGRDDEELVERTRRSLREAGDRAAGLNAYAAAEDYYAAALTLISRDDPERPDLLFRCAPCRSTSRPTSAARQRSSRRATQRSRPETVRMRPRRRRSSPASPGIRAREPFRCTTSRRPSRPIRMRPHLRPRVASWPTRPDTAPSRRRRRDRDPARGGGAGDRRGARPRRARGASPRHDWNGADPRACWPRGTQASTRSRPRRELARDRDDPRQPRGRGLLRRRRARGGRAVRRGLRDRRALRRRRQHALQPR